MDPDRWRRVERIYHDARAIHGNDRAVFLDAACGSDTTLRREVESLLAQPSHDDVLASLPDGPAIVPGGGLVGQRVGAYQVQSVLGAGGMGEVYRALDVRLGRTVAFKVLPITSRAIRTA